MADPARGLTGLLALAAAGIGVVALAEAARGAPGAAARRLEALLRALAGAFDALLRLGREGREPGALERRRMLLAVAGAGLLAGSALARPAAGAALALAAPMVVSRVLRAHRLAYRRAVERSVPAVAGALADALRGGHSLRGALADASESVPGAGGAELRRVAAELATGERTDAALEALRGRCPGPSVDALVTAALVHRRAGGDLARLLRGLAAACDERRRLEDEARAATAQARFSGVIVTALPPCGTALAELASPGFAAGLISSPLTAWLVGVAVALQAAAALLVRRLGRFEA